MTLIALPRAAAHYFGPNQFYRLSAQLWEGKTHLSWPDWDEFFGLAQECGMIHCEEVPKGFSPLYATMAHNLVMQWRRVKRARERGESAWGFHCSEKLRIEGEEREVRERQARYDAERAAKIGGGKYRAASEA